MNHQAHQVLPAVNLLSVTQQAIQWIAANVANPAGNLLQALRLRWTNLPRLVKMVIICMSLAGCFHLVIAAVGFGAAGVAAGSAAAGIQAAIGNVVAGSTFAAFQSLGAAPAVIYVYGAVVGMFF